MKRIGSIASLLAALALLITTAAIYGQAAEQGPEALKGKASPDFTLKTLEGKEVKLSDQKGKVVLLDFWATWCPPCVKGLPHIQKLADDTTLAEKGLVVWAVNVSETKDKIEPFMKKHKLSMPVPIDADGATMQKYAISSIPTTIVVGRDGTVKKVVVGFHGDEGVKDLHAAVEEALKEAPPEA